MSDAPTTVGGLTAGSSEGRTIERWSLPVFVLLTVAISWPAWGVLAVYDLEPGINLAGILWLLGGLGPWVRGLGLGMLDSIGAIIATSAVLLVLVGAIGGPIGGALGGQRAQQTDELSVKIQ